MATEVVMPQMGESIAEGTITKWLVKIGDKVERDQPLFEISTDKVDAEIPSPAAGVLIEIRNQEGETVPVNQVVATIGEAGEAAGAAAPAASAAGAAAPAAGAAPPAATAPAAPAAPAAPPAPAPAAASAAPAASAAGKAAEPSAPAPAPAPAPDAPPQPAAAAAEQQAAAGAAPAAREETSSEGAAAASGAAAGGGASGPRRLPSPASPAAAGADAAEEQQEVRRDEGESDLARESDREELSEGERLRKFSSPLVRSIAAKEGVDLQEVAGTGAQGRVTKGDILSFLEQRRTAPAPARPAAVPAPPAGAPSAPAPAGAPQPLRPAGGFSVPAYVEGEDFEIEPMSKIRQITAAHMVYSKATSAHVTTIFDLDMSRIARIRARAKEKFARQEGTKLTFMPFIFKAVVNGLKAHRKLNASIDGTNIVYKKNINLGMAVDLGHGLIVPVIKHADHLNLIGLAKAANDLAERARGKKLKPEEVQGGTFTITNPGVFGSLFGTPIINQPQVAILGVGAIEKRPVVVEDADGNDSLSIRTRCYFGITY
ncbi:MAG TPA: dihydrolipoamide acetyltransferase family protein, partial [Thermoanaerobaculia bacterium]|nr:dihydrolipoamide acetyltransferase family protein [Thermoanaerobaculia bacterium]